MDNIKFRRIANQAFMDGFNCLEFTCLSINDSYLCSHYWHNLSIRVPCFIWINDEIYHLLLRGVK
jgi:hypothetical protein